MTGEKSPWVGDQVYDANADREGVISDVRNGTYILRPVHSYWGQTWTAPDPEKLTVTVPRKERIKREREV
ncbi:hypothetical protein [Streptomyces griseoloalbus]|uniref:Uncharacterized protein n=1 Tax=Streptomyces griseoloalbus TaxID=67303 RepID=A0A7W8BTL3_9ACTN|nr:hypothetical protein [Streptomyces albaduncus]MBB5129366.1 hypothetical protein [Streptomyces albaduncus]GGV85689.1 hypothetical protein GCM10010294_65340 [Streptomyces griseoloalbus]GGW67214.1 hypothetical protein GCM10010340_51790 [Streptomyces albaduncus]